MYRLEQGRDMGGDTEIPVVIREQGFFFDFVDFVDMKMAMAPPD